MGNAWATNVNVIASQKGLYEGLESMDTSAALTRDNAAQMVWNAMNAYEVEYKTTIITDEMASWRPLSPSRIRLWLQQRQDHSAGGQVRAKTLPVPSTATPMFSP